MTDRIQRVILAASTSQLMTVSTGHLTGCGRAGPQICTIPQNSEKIVEIVIKEDISIDRFLDNFSRGFRRFTAFP